MYQYNFHSMSTIVQISISHELYANDLMPIYKQFSMIEDTCSRFRADSELSRMNQQVGKEVPVSSEMFSILTKAYQFYLETDGVFNPSVLDALENNGYEKSIEFIRDREIELPTRSSVAFHTQPYTLNEELQTVSLHSKIDLGGIAKCWVIDQSAQLLNKIGYGFINVGGDIRIFGNLPRPLNIGIEDPFGKTNMISSIKVENGAVATSTSMKRKWRVNGEWKHHLIDTRTGNPSESTIVSSTITAPTALEADVWAKTILFLGEKDGPEWIKEKGTHAVLINKYGDVWRGGE
ncbi:FAD:protein FMN transferase [Bacillus sp. S3]|uniref:FAD:protein FMN transferase n=1 Tax=Bacillus sp. S3 TaxID=486398 RepID=UPI00118D4A9D|nr:FAD:protein FMN transferase [Bacillus sp. S3]QCJ43795.1 FAD:protein FMN transferase [Bacillus sp. S3]